MATYTSYLNLEKPTTSETFNLLKLNQNWDKIDAAVSALNSKMTWRQIYVNTTYTDHTGVTLQLSESLQNVKLLFITAYSQSISSANRIVFIIPVRSNIVATYFIGAYGTNVQTIRIEGSGTSFTVLSSSLPNGLFINEILALG